MNRFFWRPHPAMSEHGAGRSASDLTSAPVPEEPHGRKTEERE